MKEKSSYTLRYFLFQTGRLKTCTVFSVIFSLLGFPVMCIAQNMIDKTSKLDEIAIPLMVIGVIGIGGACVMSCITPVIALRHLYTRTEADNILSLPLTANKRFLADIGSIYTSFHLPYALSVLLAYFCDKISYDMVNANAGSTGVWNYSVYGLILVIMLCAFNSAVITCCGRVKEAVIYPLLLNIVIPLCIILGGMISFKECPGMTYYPEYEVFTSPVMLLSPVSAFIFCIYYGIYISLSNMLYIGGAAMAIIYLAIAFLGYKARRAENIGKPFVFRHTFLIFSSLTALTLVLGYCYLTDYSITELRSVTDIVILGLLLLILMLIMDVINGGKIKKLWKFAVKYAATYGLGIVLCLGLIASKAFGAGYYVPDPEDIEFVSVNYSNWDNEENSDAHYCYGGICATDTEAFELITAEHQRIIDNNADLQEYENYIQIQYFLKNGKDVSRAYKLSEMSPEFSHKLYEIESYRVSALNGMSEMDYYYRNGISVELVHEPSRIQLVNRDTDYVYLDSGKKTIDEELLKEALEKDLRADTEYGRHDEYPVGKLKIGTTHESTNYQTGETEEWFGSGTTFDIYESYTNTIDYLKQYGTVPTAEQALDDAVKNQKIFVLTRFTTAEREYSYTQIYTNSDEKVDFVLITEEEYRELAKKTTSYHHPAKDGENYIYSLHCVIPVDMNFYPKEDFVDALNEIGIEYDNYDFLNSLESYSGAFYFNDLNEEYNQDYAQFFSDRRVFSFDEQ